MELLVVVLNRVEFLTDLLDEFTEEGLSGATVIDSAGMGHILADHVPFFSMFAEIDDPTKNHSKTIFTVVDCCDKRERAIRAVEKAVGDIDKPDTAIIFTVPVSFAKGIIKKEKGEK